MMIVVSVLLSTALSPMPAGVPSFASGMDACWAEQSKLLPINGILRGGAGAERWSAQSGYADSGTRPISPQTQFRLASVGKVFTRIAIGQLIDAGKLKLEHSARTYLPELPQSFQAVTIGQLLEHRAGVQGLTHMTPDQAPALAGAKTARDLVPLIASSPLEFTPGTAQAYSNGGYILLGAVVEAASGLSYRDYVERNIFGPLAMSHSSFEPEAHAAVQMTTFGGPNRPPLATPQPRLEMAAFKASPAGDTLSSAEDMEKLAMALIGEKLLSSTAKAAVFPRSSDPWQLGQAGGSIGTNTDFRVFPDRNSWLVVLSNRDPPAAEIAGLVLARNIVGKGCKPMTPKDVQSPFGGPPPPSQG